MSIPRWAKFKAQDANGRWCWYEFEPTAGADAWVVRRGFFAAAERDSPNENWRDTLTTLDTEQQ